MYFYPAIRIPKPFEKNTKFGSCKKRKRIDQKDRNQKMYGSYFLTCIFLKATLRGEAAPVPSLFLV